jgi:uncharacterized membrane protein YdjX (TVP38/TMEM64 family)
MRPRRRRWAVGLLVVALIGLAVTVRPARVVPTIRTTIFSPWFPLVLVGLYALRPFVGWPVMVLSALVGFRYGVLVGLPIALAGAVVTSLVPYGAGRIAPESGRLVGRFSTGSQAYFQRTGGVRGVVAARLAPLPAEPVSAAAGAGGVSVPAFVLGTVVGETPWTIAAVSIGHSMTVFAVSAVTVDWWLVSAGVLVAVALLARPVARAVRARWR